jgi:hypothetical protein
VEQCINEEWVQSQQRFEEWIRKAQQEDVARIDGIISQQREIDGAAVEKMWQMEIAKLQTERGGSSVRGHPSISLLPLLSPTPPPVHMYSPSHLCTISKDHTYSRRLSSPTVRRLSRSRLTNNRRVEMINWQIKCW